MAVYHREGNKTEKKAAWPVRLLRYLFPWKGDRPKDIIFKLIFLAAIICFVVCACQLGSYWLDCMKSDETVNSLQNLISSSPDTSSGAQGEAQGPEESKFERLYALNSDFVGWVSIEGTKLDQPVMQTQSPEYYLRRGFDKKYSINGTPFVDHRTLIGEGNVFHDHTIIYGHNMRSGRLFGSIKDFRNLEVYQAHPTLQFDTIYGDGEYKIIGAMVVNFNPDKGSVFNYHLVSDFEDEQAFNDFISEVHERSFIWTGVDVEYGDKLLTLSTCTDDDEDQRFALVARRVREGEDATVDISQAKANPSPKQ